MAISNARPIVVVGAGVIGLSAALHAREQFPDRPVVVLEAGAVGDGTTPAGAGFVAPWATVLPHLGASGLALAEYSLGFYRDLAATTPSARYRENGNLVLFSSQESMDAAVPAIMGGPLVSDDTRVVSAADVARLTSGAVDPSRVAGAVHMARGIQLETGAMLARLAEVATDAGVEIRHHSPVAEVVVEDGRVSGVLVAAPGGDSTVPLDSDLVVLTVGAWLNELLAPLECALPLLPFVATRFVTSDVGIAPTMPTIQAKDFPLWIRESGGGFTWGSTPGCAPAHRLGGAWASHDPARRRRDDLVEAMAADAARVAETFPALAGAEVVEVIQGMPVYTVDRQFFLGEVPGSAGVWVVGGDNESGVSHGPGLGRLVAELAAGVDAPLCDASAYRLDRFAPGQYPDAESVGQEFARTHGGFVAEAMARRLAPA